MVLGNRLIDIRSFWRPNIQIVKIAICDVMRVLMSCLRYFQSGINDTETGTVFEEIYYQCALSKTFLRTASWEKLWLMI